MLTSTRKHSVPLDKIHHNIWYDLLIGMEQAGTEQAGTPRDQSEPDSHRTQDESGRLLQMI